MSSRTAQARLAIITLFRLPAHARNAETHNQLGAAMDELSAAAVEEDRLQRTDEEVSPTLLYEGQPPVVLPDMPTVQTHTHSQVSTPPVAKTKRPNR